MKTLKWAITFIIIFAVFAVFLFPYEAYLKNICRKLEKEKNITVTWEKGSFFIWKTELENVNIQTADQTGGVNPQYDKIIITPHLAGLKIRALKNGSESAVILTNNKIVFDIKGLYLPNVSNLGGGILGLKGNFFQKNKTGEGNFTLIVNNLTLKNYAGRVVFNGTYNIRPDKFNFAFTASGSGITGDGEAYMAANQSGGDLPVNGTAYFYYGNIGKKFNIIGTIKNISLSEQ